MGTMSKEKEVSSLSLPISTGEEAVEAIDSNIVATPTRTQDLCLIRGQCWGRAAGEPDLVGPARHAVLPDRGYGNVGVFFGCQCRGDPQGSHQASQYQSPIYTLYASALSCLQLFSSPALSAQSGLRLANQAHGVSRPASENRRISFLSAPSQPHSWLLAEA